MNALPTEIVDADPMVESTTPPAVAMDFPHHVNTYNRFVHLLKWFVIHMAILAIALYFFIIEANGAGGSVFLLLAIGALTYGILSLPGGRTAAAATMGLTEREPDQH